MPNTNGDPTARAPKRQRQQAQLLVLSKPVAPKRLPTGQKRRVGGVEQAADRREREGKAEDDNSSRSEAITKMLKEADGRAGSREMCTRRAGKTCERRADDCASCCRRCRATGACFDGKVAAGGRSEEAEERGG